MYSFDSFVKILDDIAPLELSTLQIEQGAYDNSGVLIRTHDTVDKVLFTLDLSVGAVQRAKRLGCDTIVTHHPAIYVPLKELSVCNTATKPVLKAIEYKMNVISFHLNLDVAENGIDAKFCNALGGEKYKILFPVKEGLGYGREFVLDDTVSQFVAKIKRVLNTKRVVYYGNKNTKISKVASFCGGGGSHAVDAVKKGLTDANVIVSADMPHHVIEELVEANKCVIIISHYASEDIGFNAFFSAVSQKLENQIKTYYFCDKRFI